jgi:hypothetical protein
MDPTTTELKTNFANPIYFENKNFNLELDNTIRFKNTFKVHINKSAFQ